MIRVFPSPLTVGVVRVKVVLGAWKRVERLESIRATGASILGLRVYRMRWKLLYTNISMRWWYSPSSFSSVLLFLSSLSTWHMCPRSLPHTRLPWTLPSEGTVVRSLEPSSTAVSSNKGRWGVSKVLPFVAKDPHGPAPPIGIEFRVSACAMKVNSLTCLTRIHFKS